MDDPDDLKKERQESDFHIYLFAIVATAILVPALIGWAKTAPFTPNYRPPPLAAPQSN